MQRGVITQRGASWVLRCNEKVIENGKEVWKSRTIRLAPVGGAYRTAQSCRALADEKLAALSGSNAKPTSTEDFERFLSRNYLPHVRESLKETTAKTYAALFKLLRPHLGKIELREVDSPAVNEMLAALEAEKPQLVHNTFTKCKRFLSSAWKYAKGKGLVNGACPIDGSVTIPKGRRSLATHAYSLDEVVAIHDAVPERYKAMISVFAFCGLRKEEVKGLRWEDFDGTHLHVHRTVIEGKVIDGTKTEASAAPVPCNEQVVADLKRHRRLTRGQGFIFHGREPEKPLSIENDTARVIRPALKAKKVDWHGWHSFRRGTATMMHKHGSDDKTIQGVMRHTELRTTTNIYMKHDDEKARQGLDKLAESFKSKVVTFRARKSA
jgi:integrase